MSSDKFGEFLITRGLLERQQVADALDIQADSTVKIGTICLEEGYMTMKQVMDTLRARADSSKPFEDLAIQLEYLTAQQLAQAIKIQNQRRPFFGELLVKLELIERKQLFDELAAFWANANLPKSKTQEEEEDDTVYVELEFPLMYPEELAEFIEDVEESLQNIALSLSRFKPGAHVAELAQEVAFFANKIRGAAELDGIDWLAEVSGEMEQGMLLIEKDPREEGTPAIIAMYFRATDAIHHFLESIQGDYAHADATVVQDLHKSLAAYGVLEDIATQDKIGELIGARAEPEKPAGPVTLEGKHILLIDDDTVIRNTLERHLRSSQCVVEQAKNGAIGLDRLVGTMMDFDLVIVDLHMPIMDGFEFVTEVRKQSKYDSLPIIMFTASLHMADVRKAINLGINGYVIKREWKNCLMPEIKRAIGVTEDAA
ncbi:MAG: response regulator [Myxococcota bacterium]|nr:response regulator [Myxococcota bacterium]